MKKKIVILLLIGLIVIFVALLSSKNENSNNVNEGNTMGNNYNVSNENNQSTENEQSLENIQSTENEQSLENNQVIENVQNTEMAKENGAYNVSSENTINEKTQIKNAINEISNSISTKGETINKETDVNKKKTDGSTYYIKVNNKDNKVNIYEKDESGEYSILVRGMVCSVGTHTPVSKKYPQKTYKMNGQRYKWLYLQGNVYGQYATRITGHILFHSVPYKFKSSSSLEYWEFDKLGTSASLGCIRLQVADAKWIYDKIPEGTVVEFDTDVTNDATASKISENEQCRNWDPTDPSDQNPWNEN